MAREIIAHPSNLVLPYCQTAMFARCLENRVFAVTTNRYGTEELADERLTFTGASQIMTPGADDCARRPSRATVWSWSRSIPPRPMTST